jgi:endonuclease/exonuclease/phosphatase (EEP) superfamily protein YafD
MLGGMADSTLKARSTGLRAAIAFLCSRFVWVLVAFLAFCQGAIWLRPMSPMLASIENFALPLCTIAAVAAVLALLLRRWVSLAVSCLLAASLAWPAYPFLSQPVVAASPAGLKVLSVNLWYAAREHDRTIDMLMTSEADIIGLVEVAPDWHRALAPLIAKYPYHVDCLDTESFCETILLSKLPIVKPFAGRVWRSNPIVAGGEVAWQGKRFTVFVTHFTWPLERIEDSKWAVASDPSQIPDLPGSLPATRQVLHASRLAKFLDDWPADAIVMGDFNSAPWSRVQTAFRAATGFDNPAGWQTTWPRWLPWPLRLPLDHVLARGHLVVTSFVAGPATDSDHLPVIAEIGWRD